MSRQKVTSVFNVARACNVRGIRILKVSSLLKIELRLPYIFAKLKLDKKTRRTLVARLSRFDNTKNKQIFTLRVVAKLAPNLSVHKPSMLP